MNLFLFNNKSIPLCINHWLINYTNLLKVKGVQVKINLSYSENKFYETIVNQLYKKKCSGKIFFIKANGRCKASFII